MVFSHDRCSGDSADGTRVWFGGERYVYVPCDTGEDPPEGVELEIEVVDHEVMR